MSKWKRGCAILTSDQKTILGRVRNFSGHGISAQSKFLVLEGIELWMDAMERAVPENNFLDLCDQNRPFILREYWYGDSGWFTCDFLECSIVSESATIEMKDGCQRGNANMFYAAQRQQAYGDVDQLATSPVDNLFVLPRSQFEDLIQTIQSRG